MKQDFRCYFRAYSIFIIFCLSTAAAAGASIIFSSCARIQYIFEQGRGQLKLQNSAKDNEVVLKNPQISKEYKQKIGEILEYKKFFYDFFSKANSKIYSKTTILDDQHVTYLVVASKFYEIKAKDECFPFVGCFPYLGFFSKESAYKYANDLEKEEYVTTVYPVNAYSTLGFFEDTILSSFFNYDRYQLAELIFHELFHSIFFVKNKVELNENLANFFAGELVKLYFSKEQKDVEELAKHQRMEDNYDQIKSEIVKMVNILQDRYSKEKPSTKELAQKILDSYLQHDFYPQVKKLCEKFSLKNSQCYFLDKKWNNASFVSLLTYQRKFDEIAKIKSEMKLSLIDFYRYIEKNWN
ncbi:MAG: aminopeptidase [Oligoflexia bacterium]|nr:aminopeptidase [Oligoflexia bacterium]